MKARSFGTHDGTFHADEVTACSLLLLFDRIDREKIIRSRDLARLSECEYVCDVGGIFDPAQKRFDHHQSDYQGTLSSAGMVLGFLKTEEPKRAPFCEYLYRSLVAGVDAHDIGALKLEAGVTSFSHVISNFMPAFHDAPREEVDAAFFQAVSFALGHLERMEERFLYAAQCKGIVAKVMEKGERCLMFDQSLPWIDNFFELGGELHPAQFVVMPAGEHWKLRGIPPSSSERMKVRLPLPESWAGLGGEELERVSKIPGAIFCHKGRFISIWETKESALEALHAALEKI